jgi:20S proteasome subunit beta 5
MEKIELIFLLLALCVPLVVRSSSLDQPLSIPTRTLNKYTPQLGLFEDGSTTRDVSSLISRSFSHHGSHHFEHDEEAGHELPADLNSLQYHGTTTLSFICNDGIIVAVDSRASMGKYVGSRTTRKVFPISKYTLATMAGGAADCAHYIRYATRIAKLLEHRSGAQTPVKTIATILAQNLRENRAAKLSVGTMVCGWDRPDREEGGPVLYYVDSEGTCVPGESFCVGSGANHAYSVLDSKDVASLSPHEAVEHAAVCIRLATSRDGYSGGYINVFHIGKDGIKHMKRVRAHDISVV